MKNKDVREIVAQSNEIVKKVFSELNQDMIEYKSFIKAKRHKVIEIDLSKELTLKQCANLCKVSLNTVRSWVTFGKVVNREIPELGNVNLIQIQSLDPKRRRAIEQKLLGRIFIEIDLSEEMDLKDFVRFSVSNRNKVKKWIEEKKVDYRVISELDDLILIKIDSYTVNLDIDHLSG